MRKSILWDRHSLWKDSTQNSMTKTQQKEMISHAKALIDKCGGTVKAAAKIGVTVVTLNNLLHGERLYKKTTDRFAKKFGMTVTDAAPAAAPKKALKVAKKAKKSAKAKASKPKTKAKASKPKPKASKSSKPSKAKAKKSKVSNGAAGPSHAAEVQAASDALASALPQ